MQEGKHGVSDVKTGAEGVRVLFMLALPVP
jgi:hypothetical protein